MGGKMMLAGQKPVIILKQGTPYKKGISRIGINELTANVEDICKGHIIEPLGLGTQKVQSAVDCGFIDNIITLNNWKYSPPEKVRGMGELGSYFFSIHPFSFFRR
jgi:hypothetical protein